MWCQRVHHAVPANGNGHSAGSEAPWLMKWAFPRKFFGKDGRRPAGVDTSVISLA